MATTPPPPIYAYPTSTGDDWHGMLLRDYFAGEAMKALLRQQPGDPNIAQRAYAVADLMMAYKAATGQ